MNHAMRKSIDFTRAPFTVIWEVTRACDLRCRHCRADAQPEPDPRELTTAEGRRLLEQIRDLGGPVFVITGGDPLKRPDLFRLIDHATRIGLPVALTPSGTPLLTREAIQHAHDAGARRIALSLDGSSAANHDRFRQQPGSYAWTVGAVRHAVDLGVSVQVNTTVTRHNLGELEAIADVIAGLGVGMWSLFFLVTVGRARRDDQLQPAECEGVFAFLYDLSRRAPFAVRTTAAPHYRRFVLQRRAAERRAGRREPVPWLAGMIEPRAPRGVTDGNGIVFISHTGEVYPSGFLPLRAGNVREQPLATIYRNAPILRRLRDTEQLGGKCGVCEFRRVCGGSRARAFATTGDPMASDPLCAYEPSRRRPTAA